MINATDRNKALYVAELFNQVFGVQSPIFLPYGRKENYTAGNYPDITLMPSQEAEAVSWMGTSVFGSFTLAGGAYQTYARDGRIETLQMSDFVMPYATLVDFQQNMILTQTRTVGNTGTVKEVYGLDDWKISIRGLCLNDDFRPTHATAQEQAQALTAWRNLACSIEVVGRQFLEKKIHNIVIQSLAIRPVQGKSDVVSFEIEALSDQAIELIDVL